MNISGNLQMHDVTAVVASVSGGAAAYKAGDVISKSHEPVSFIANHPNLPVILQILGAFVAVAGLILGIVRIYQNHLDRKLKREILEWEKHKHATTTNTQTKIATQDAEH